VEALYNELQAEEVLLTPEMQAERRKEIRAREDSVATYHNVVFGVDGLFFLKKKELIKPVQDLVFEAVEKVCKKQRLQIMFDKAGDMVIIYSNPVHDYTDYVLEELGLGDEEDVVK
jgi:outer membrane protein